MSVAGSFQGALEYFPCRYGKSRLLFRGPKRALDGRYVAFLGGAETFGRFVESPFPALVERALVERALDDAGIPLPCVNLGVINAGIDLYIGDPAVLNLAARADLCVIQVMGAQNMSNRFYGVHPRRNDRFLRASDRLQQLFPEVDFTEFHFTLHMLGRLREISEERFAEVTAELRLAWVARMKHLLTLLGGRAVVLWAAGHTPPETHVNALSPAPLFIERGMIEALRPRAAALLDRPLSAGSLQAGTEGMIFADFEAAAAAEALSPAAHEEIAAALTPALSELLTREE
ncbi:DUF6473 family protein [Alloyangia pacifica]|uniref:DUF6473 domain-containing protein n=1 Tax=Alloyangia pacifica TaxID=311180 RepID=A0A1I6UAP2_9RHOB|nr:DUF6473 family protein [Alloyangia pacifica]SDH44629.1 hypothetical protein SAMN04488245_107291 [Alloyangia pacifica]SFS98464.1 hypothetical protein SAMN04488050_107291 [Alloyangia pacifica]